MTATVTGDGSELKGSLEGRVQGLLPGCTCPHPPHLSYGESTLLPPKLGSLLLGPQGGGGEGTALVLP